MIIHWYVINAGNIEEQPTLTGWPAVDLSRMGESWFDIEDAGPAELRQFLLMLNLHPVMLGRCLDKANSTGIISYDQAMLLEFPAALNLENTEQAYLTILLKERVLVTIRHSSIPVLNELVFNLNAEKNPDIRHLMQIVYLILDELTDQSVQAETGVRDRILYLAKTMADSPAAVNHGDLNQVRWQVDKLISLVEDQLYCISGLNASDNEALQEPHRKAYIQDLVSEIEIAQRGVYRLEARVNGLSDTYQLEQSSHVEKRLRIPTIVSAITLPFSLIAGLLGMNVGGLPGMQDPMGFIIVIVLMAAIGAVELWYFRWKGWFE
ncbi:MAG TPA: CorA family divalent cation transporter [Methanoregula sp.]|nr:CorA family divalent cation transporter [Methanoregula sp.]